MKLVILFRPIPTNTYLRLMTDNNEEKKPMDMFRSGLRALDDRMQYPDI